MTYLLQQSSIKSDSKTTDGRRKEEMSDALHFKTDDNEHFFPNEEKNENLYRANENENKYNISFTTLFDTV